MVVESGYPGGIPGEVVDVAVSAPLGHDCLPVAIDHVETVEDGNHRPVGFVGASSDIDHDKVTVGDLNLRIYFRHSPDVKTPLGIGDEF